MELKDALLARRSCRKYTDELVSDEDINELLHAAMSGSIVLEANEEYYSKTSYKFSK